MTHPPARWQPGTTAGARPAARLDRANGSMPRPRPAAPAEMLPDAGIEENQLPDLQLYERLIGDGIAAADARGSAVDHVTARRLAICLAARPQSPVRPQPGPLRPYRGRQSRAEDPTAHPRPLRYLRRSATGRPADGILHRPRHGPRPGRGELRRRLRPDRPRRHPARRRPRPRSAQRPGTRANLARDRRAPHYRLGPP